MSRVLALDLATNSGWAYGSPTEGVIESGAYRLPKTGEDAGLYGYKFECWLDSTISRLEPAMIFFEKPSQFKKTTPITVLKLNGLAFMTEVIAHKRQIDCLEANVQDITTHFCGKGAPRFGDARKQATIAKCRERGWKPGCDNEADALALLDYAFSLMQPAHALQAVPMFHETRLHWELATEPHLRGHTILRQQGNEAARAVVSMTDDGKFVGSILEPGMPSSDPVTHAAAVGWVVRHVGEYIPGAVIVTPELAAA